MKLTNGGQSRTDNQGRTTGAQRDAFWGFLKQEPKKVCCYHWQIYRPLIKCHILFTSYHIATLLNCIVFCWTLFNRYCSVMSGDLNSLNVRGGMNIMGTLPPTRRRYGWFAGWSLLKVKVTCLVSFDIRDITCTSGSCHLQWEYSKLLIRPTHPQADFSGHHVPNEENFRQIASSTHPYITGI